MPWVHFDREERRIHVREGQDLREAAIQEGVNVYPRPFHVLNCHGRGLCGKCQVRVLNPDAVEYERKPINILGMEIDPNALVMAQENLIFRKPLPGFNHPLSVVAFPLLIGILLVAGAFFVAFANGVPVLSDLVQPLKLTTLDYSGAAAFAMQVGFYEALFYGSWIAWVAGGMLLGPFVWPERDDPVDEQLTDDPDREYAGKGEIVLGCQCRVLDDVRVRTLNEDSLLRPLTEYGREFDPGEIESKLARRKEHNPQ